MSRRLRRSVAVAAFIGTSAWLAPSSAAAHGIGGVFQLPVPLGLYLAGAGIAVAASFVVTSVVARTAPGRPEYPIRAVPGPIAAATRIALRILGAAWWYGAIVVGLVVGGISPLPAVLVWIGIWVGLPIVAAVAGNPWPSLSPFRTTYAALEWLARRAGVRRLDIGLRYPAGLSRWPAVALLAAGIWAELVLPGSETATSVALLAIGYTILTLAGIVLFGQVAWLRNAELFEVYLGWFGRIGPVGRLAVDRALCQGCDEGCEPERCVDCPECAVAASDGERRAILRPWIAGLTEVDRAGWADAAFIVLALAGVSFDGMRETTFGGALIGAIQPAVIGVLGPTGAAFLVADTIAFAVVLAAFWLAFVSVALLARGLADPGASRPLGLTIGSTAATLLPIAAGYLVAHYLTLVIQGVVWLPSLVVDPLMSLAPMLDWIPVQLVWYVSVATIVGGHIAGIVLAHRIALREAPSRPTLAGLPMVALMVGYTVLSLWIIAQPIVIDPGASSAVLGHEVAAPRP